MNNKNNSRGELPPLTIEEYKADIFKAFDSKEILETIEQIMKGNISEEQALKEIGEIMYSAFMANNLVKECKEAKIFDKELESRFEEITRDAVNEYLHEKFEEFDKKQKQKSIDTFLAKFDIEELKRLRKLYEDFHYKEQKEKEDQ